jgi:biofilm PGA synthesis N-glycosyltransferase PgaC
MYALVTAARNEAEYIALTIDSVVRQLVPPAEWIIVSDGSTDGTEAIVLTASKRHPWIRLIPLAPGRQHCFSSVVRAMELGIRSLRTRYEFIGLLDADVTMDVEYFKILLSKFHSNPRLGIAGGVVTDVDLGRKRLPRNRKDVPGAVQMFRRGCLEAIGELISLPEGGWDALTCAKARMSGYETTLVCELDVLHLKARNSASGRALKRKWDFGRRDYAIGNGVGFELLKCISRIGERPYLVGSLVWFGGYLTSLLVRRPRSVPVELISFMRREQAQRIMKLLALPWPTKHLIASF